MRRGTKLHKAQARRKDFRLWLTKVGPGEHDRNISRSLRDAAVHHGRRPAGCDFAPAGQGSQSMGLARLTKLARRLGMIRSSPISRPNQRIRSCSRRRHGWRLRPLRIACRAADPYEAERNRRNGLNSLCLNVNVRSAEASWGSFCVQFDRTVQTRLQPRRRPSPVVGHAVLVVVPLPRSKFDKPSVYG
jgi:hypothetical protein